MKTTVISHFYNEEFLLPFWLKHHLPMFDHGIMIDYSSTDRSVEIIKQLAPQWEIRQSRNADFDYIACDQEVMDIEETIPDWKIALNTTEFLVHHDLKALLDDFGSRTQGVISRGLIMVERPEDRNIPLTDQLLVLQKQYGYIEADCKSHVGRHRMIHRAPNGAYSGGRHSSFLKRKMQCQELFVAWFGWSPMDYVVPRKLQIKTRIPPGHLADGKGIEHDVNEQTVYDAYSKQVPFISNLWEIAPDYKNQLDLMQASLKW